MGRDGGLSIDERLHAGLFTVPRPERGGGGATAVVSEVAFEATSAGLRRMVH